MSKRDRFLRRVHRQVRSSKSGSTNFLSIPDDLKLWYPEKEGDYDLNFVTYLVSTKDHPDNALFEDPLEIGEDWYRRPYAIHYDVGPCKRKVICPRETFGKPCPICEEVDKLYADYEANKELIKGIKAKLQCLFLVMVGEEKEVKLFNWSYFKFADQLSLEIQKNRDPSVEAFACESGGKQVVLRVIEKTLGKTAFLTGDRIDFYPRDDISITHDYKLDDFFVELSYEDIYNLFTGEGSVEDKQEGGNSEEEKVGEPEPRTRVRREAKVEPVAPVEEPEPTEPEGTPEALEGGTEEAEGSGDGWQDW